MARESERRSMPYHRIRLGMFDWIETMTRGQPQHAQPQHQGQSQYQDLSQSAGKRRRVSIDENWQNIGIGERPAKHRCR